MNQFRWDEAWRLALELHRAGRLAEAINLYDQIIGAAPDPYFAYSNRGAAHLGLGQHGAAIADFDRAIALRPDDVASHANKGLALNALGLPAEAVSAFDQALALNPDHIEARFGLMAALLASGRPAEAAQAAQAAILQRPDLSKGHYGLGLALNALDRRDEAVAAFDAALALSPGLADAHLHRAGALYGLGRLDEALAAYDQLLVLDPGREQGHYNRGKTLADLDMPQEALAAYDRAIALRPDNPDSHLNRGAALQALGDWAGAALAYQQVIRLDPSHVQGHANLGMARLALGDLRQGFMLTEWRKETHEAYGRRSFDRPEWHGDTPIVGKTLLIHAEQGLGDEMQFCRYLDLVLAAGARPILVSHPPLKALMAQSFPEVAVLAEGEPLPPFDLHAALLSLPADFKTDFESIPSRFPYLRADPARIEAWRRRLGDQGFKIGVSWHTSRRGAATGKCFPMTTYAAIAQLPNVRLISLQCEDGREEALTGALSIETLGDEFDAGPDGFLDSAAVMQCLDLVITPDTALAHLAGALARPVWTALKSSADWRWLIGRSDTPWYPTMRLFRQSRRGDWSAVFDAMHRELALSILPHHARPAIDAEPGASS